MTRFFCLVPILITQSLTTSKLELYTSFERYEFRKISLPSHSSS